MDHSNTSGPPEKAKFCLVLETTGRDPFNRPPEIRLRRLLKYAIRGLGLRCTSVINREWQEVRP